MGVESLSCAHCGSGEVQEVKPNTYFCNHCEQVSKYIDSSRITVDVQPGFCSCGNRVEFQCQVCKGTICADCDVINRVAFPYRQQSDQFILAVPAGGFGHLMARPDREIRHEPGCCGRCGAGLAGRPVTGVERRQVFGLLPVRAEVTEHQLIERECGCGQRTRGAAPPGAEAPVQYGPRIAAVIVYLYARQFLSKKHTALALSELFGIPLSSVTVAALTARAAGRLDGFLEQVRQGITASDVAGSGDTGFGWRAGWPGCTAPAPASTPCSWCTPGGAGRRSRRRASFPGSPGSPSTMPGRRMTRIRSLITSFAVLTPCASCRP